MSDTSEDAAFRIMLRQFAPNIKNLLQAFVDLWGENIFMLYLTMRYKTDSDPSKPENTVFQANSILSKKWAVISDKPGTEGYNPDAETLYELFPHLAETIEEFSKKWSEKDAPKVSVYDVMMLIRYKENSDTDDPDSIEIQFRTRANCPVRKAEIITS